MIVSSTMRRIVDRYNWRLNFTLLGKVDHFRKIKYLEIETVFEVGSRIPFCGKALLQTFLSSFVSPRRLPFAIFSIGRMFSGWLPCTMHQGDWHELMQWVQNQAFEFHYLNQCALQCFLYSLWPLSPVRKLCEVGDREMALRISSCFASLRSLHERQQ